jgi:hypothetical protein
LLQNKGLDIDRYILTQKTKSSKNCETASQNNVCIEIKKNLRLLVCLRLFNKLIYNKYQTLQRFCFVFRISFFVCLIYEWQFENIIIKVGIAE